MHDRDERRVVGRVRTSNMVRQMHGLARCLPIGRSAPCPRGRGGRQWIRFVHPVQTDVDFVRQM